MITVNECSVIPVGINKYFFRMVRNSQITGMIGKTAENMKQAEAGAE